MHANLSLSPPPSTPLDEAHAVAQRARAYMDAWPDLHTLARQVAAECLLKHTGVQWNPDKVWWHRFETSHTRHGPFTGWAHNGPPVESLTFTELVVRRFDEAAQEGPDNLDLYSGFYQQGPGTTEYDERNEVPLLPSVVMADFWALDFADHVRQRTERFWKTHGNDFRLLTKVRLLGAARQAVTEGLLLPQDLSALEHYAGVAPHQPLTLADLSQPGDASAVHVQGYTGETDAPLFTLRTPDGRVMLYTPTATPIIRGFQSTPALHRAVAAHLASPEAEAWVTQLYNAERRHQALERLRAHIGTPATPHWPFGNGEAYPHSLFTLLETLARNDLHTRQNALISNHALRKALWRGYLGAFLQVFTPFALAAWPLSLGVLIAGASRLGLDIDAALNTRSPERRKQAVVSSVFDAIATLFSLADLGLSVRGLRFDPPPHERLVSLDTWQPAALAESELNELQTQNPPSLPAPSAPGNFMEGVSLTPRGQTWITLGGRAYRVRYSGQLHTWLVVRPTAPFAFAPLRPVRLGEQGQWEWLDAPGLEGGTPPVETPFWDVYLGDTPIESAQVATRAIARQREVLAKAALPELPSEEAFLVDEHGYGYIKVNDERCYTWRQNGQYVNDLVRIYTSESHFPNHLFRFGVSHAFEAGDGDLPAYLETLFNALERLPKSNAAPLWRGGNAGRNTSGAWLRSGTVMAGDVLVTTDITSFTENPYALKSFVAPKHVVGPEEVVHQFDESSVIYQLPAGGYQSGTPIGPLSMVDQEAETVFTPGRCFLIESIKEVRTQRYRFMLVKLRETDNADGRRVFDLRTGTLFDRAAWATQVKHPGLTERLFPATQWGH